MAALSSARRALRAVTREDHASETGSASSQVLPAAQSLSGDSNRLKLEVGKFLNSVRAA
jgi:methyl-accepting chemotaxis protein